MSTDLYKLTIPAENVSEDLTDFPVLINLDQTSGTSDRDATDVFGYFDFPDNVDDNFNGLDGDPANPVLWEEPNFNKPGNTLTPVLGTIDIQNNKLKFDLTFSDTSSTIPASITQIFTNYTLSGNFDIEIEFSDMVSQNGEYILYYLIIYGKTLQSTFIGKQPDTMVFRSRIDSNTDVTSSATTNDFGKLRLNRTNSTITTSYMDGNGSWIELQSLDTGITEDLGVLLSTYVDSNPAFTSSCNFNNFKLNSGNVVWGKENYKVNDEFTGNDGESANPDFWLSPQSESSISNNSTTFNIKNNSLRYIQPLDVALNNNSQIVSKYALSGDFDVKIDFTKVITPNSHHFTLRAMDSQDVNNFTNYFSIAKYPASNNNYNAIINGVISQTGGSDDTTGKFRLTRIGTTATCYYWNGSSWVQLLSDDFNNNNMYICIFARSWGGSSTAEMQFDNYVLTNGTLVWDDLVTDLSEMEVTVSGTQEFYQKMIDLNPVTYWRMNELSGTVAVDQMGAYNGTYPSGIILNHSISPTEIPCVKWVGTSDATSRLTTQLDVNPFSEITINFLIKKDNLVANSWGRIANWSSSYSTSWTDSPFFLTVGNTGNISISLSKGDDYSSDLSISSINDVRLEWRMVTITLKDNDHISIFMDGKLDNTLPLTFALSNSTRKFTIGANAYSQSGGLDTSYLQGLSLSEFSVFNRVLTDTEIAELHQESLSVISLPIEIDRWDQINKQAQLWTKIPKLFSNKNNELTLSKMKADYSTYINSLNPLAYYRLGETSGTIAYDENGSYNGTYVNSPSLGEVGGVVDDLNTCVKFNGIDSYMTLPQSLNNTLCNNLWSISVLAKNDGDSYRFLQTNDIASDQDSPNTDDRVLLSIFGSNISIGTMTSYWSNWDSVSSGWHHIVFNQTNSTTLLIYVDGVLFDTIVVGGCIAISQQDIVIGVIRNPELTQFSTSFIDELSIFNYSLSQQEINEIYKQSIAKLENPNIGYTGSSSAQDVWTEYDAVYHLSKDGMDSTGNTLDGSMVNMGTGNVVDFGQGKGMYFNGRDQSLNMGIEPSFNLSATQNMTVEHFISIVDTANTSWRGLQNRGTGNGGEHGGFQFSGNSATPNKLSNVYVDDGNGAYTSIVANGHSIADNEIFSSTMIYKYANGKVNLYKNGILENDDNDNTFVGSLSNQPIASLEGTSIGSAFDDNNQYLLGTVKEVRFSKTLKADEWIARNNDSINDNLFTFESLTFNHITGTIVETFTMSEWLVRAWLESDGSLTNEKIVTGDTFSLEIVASRKFPHIVTVSPMIGDIWTKLTTFNFDDLIYPTDPVTNPYYFKCIIGGIGGELEPIWTDTIGDQVVDGGVTWELIEGLIQPITHYPVMPV